MIGIDGLIEVCLMTSKTRIRCIGIIPVVTSGTITGDCSMCTVEHIEVIMDVESGWDPITLGMTSCTIIVKLQFYVLWVCGGIVICLVTSKTGIWSIVVIAVVTSRTVRSDLRMRPIEDIIVVVHIEGRRVPLRISRVASRAIGG